MDTDRTNATPQRSSRRRIQRYAWLLTIFWTLVVGISVGWALQEEERRKDKTPITYTNTI